MHAERSHKVAFHEPEGLGEKQSAGDLLRDTVDDLTPELKRHVLVELRLAHAVFGARRDRAAGARSWEPEPVKVALGKRHRRVKANHGEQARHVENGLYHVLANGRIQVVELRSVIPGEAGAVVAVVDVADFAARLVAALKYNS